MIITYRNPNNFQDYIDVYFDINESDFRATKRAALQRASCRCSSDKACSAFHKNNSTPFSNSPDTIIFLALCFKFGDHGPNQYTENVAQIIRTDRINVNTFVTVLINNLFTNETFKHPHFYYIENRFFLLPCI